MASVAVVITGVAARTDATSAAREFAPPPWPPSSDTAYRPASSTHTTPGSVVLSASSGASSRTVAPVARKHTNCSHSANALSTARRTGPS